VHAGELDLLDALGRRAGLRCAQGLIRAAGLRLRRGLVRRLGLDGRLDLVGAVAADQAALLDLDDPLLRRRALLGGERLRSPSVWVWISCWSVVALWYASCTRTSPTQSTLQSDVWRCTSF
jgi:hypothetical protein